jgi:hypothetical protein
VISEDAVREILSQYKKFGWRLERVLLTSDLKKSLGDSIAILFENASVAESDLDAAWFSRPAVNGRIAWELRSLTNTPFALVDSSEPEADESELAEIFSRIEDEMRQRLIRLPQTH